MSTAPTADPTTTPAPAASAQPAPEAPAAPEATAPESAPTLHDFVLNLLGDADLRSAFEVDPQGTLDSLGLGDVVPADVYDVLPLVVDSVPMQGLTDLGAVQSLGLSSLSASPTAVVGQVQTVANQFTTGLYATDVDVTVADVAGVSIDPNGLSVTAASSALPMLGLGSGVTVDLSGVYDVADSLDSTVLDVAGGLGVVDGALGAADLAATTVTSAAGTTDVGSLTDLGGVTGTLGGVTDLGDVTGTLGGVTDLGDVTGTLGGVTHLNGVTGTLGGVTDLDGTLGSVTGTAGGALDGVADLDSTLGGVTDLGGTAGNVTGSVDGALGGVTGLLGAGDLGVQHLADGVL